MAVPECVLFLHLESCYQVKKQSPMLVKSSGKFPSEGDVLNFRNMTENDCMVANLKEKKLTFHT